jgi:hypothetical protein
LYAGVGYQSGRWQHAVGVGITHNDINGSTYAESGNSDPSHMGAGRVSFQTNWQQSYSPIAVINSTYRLSKNWGLGLNATYNAHRSPLSHVQVNVSGSTYFINYSSQNLLLFVNLTYRIHKASRQVPVYSIFFS